jgi:site-specific DNA recombinase
MAPAPTPTRAAIYTRISDDHRQDERIGVQSQETQCRALCASRGWSVVAVHEDNDRSASTGAPRPGYQALLASMVGGEVDALVATYGSRFTREPDEREALIRTARALGVALATVSGDLDVQTAGGRLTVRIKGAVDTHESEILSERQRVRMADVAARGRPHGGRRAYGFKDLTLADGTVKRTTEIDEHEAACIREVTASLIAGGSLRGACRLLNGRGDLSPMGHPWSSTNLARTLLSPRVAGQREHRGALYPAAWQPIISATDQAVLAAILRDPARRRKGRPALHLLSGLLHCQVCGATLERQGVAAYRCPHSCVTIAEAPVAEYLTAHLLTHTESAETVAPDVERVDTSADEAQLAAISAALGRAAPGLKPEAAFAAMAEIQARIDAAQAQTVEQIAAAAAAAKASGLQSTWAGMSTEEKRETMRTLLGRIDVGRQDEAAGRHGRLTIEHGSRWYGQIPVTR